MFENLFVAQMKRLKLKRYDVCKLLKCTMPTLKSRLQNPTTFTIGEAIILAENGFYLNAIMDSIFEVYEVEFPQLLKGISKEKSKFFINSKQENENN